MVKHKNLAYLFSVVATTALMTAGCTTSVGTDPTDEITTRMTTNPQWEITASDLGVDRLVDDSDVDWGSALESWNCAMQEGLTVPGGYYDAPASIRSWQYARSGDTLLKVGIYTAPGLYVGVDFYTDVAASELIRCSEADYRLPADTETTGIPRSFEVGTDGLRWSEIRTQPFTPDTAGPESYDPWTAGSPELPFDDITERHSSGIYASIAEAYVVVYVTSAGPPRFTTTDVIEIVREKIDENPPAEPSARPAE